MPTLELDDGTFITESIAICRYFEALHPEPSLMGDNAEEIAIIEMWQRRFELLAIAFFLENFRMYFGRIWMYVKAFTHFQQTS